MPDIVSPPLFEKNCQPSGPAVAGGSDFHLHKHFKPIIQKSLPLRTDKS